MSTVTSCTEKCHVAPRLRSVYIDSYGLLFCGYFCVYFLSSGVLLSVRVPLIVWKDISKLTRVERDVNRCSFAMVNNEGVLSILVHFQCM